MYEELLISTDEIKFFKEDIICYQNLSRQYSISKKEDRWAARFNDVSIHINHSESSILLHDFTTLQEAAEATAKAFLQLHKQVYGTEVVVNPQMKIERVFQIKIDPLFYQYNWANWLGTMSGSHNNWRFHFQKLFPAKTFKQFQTIVEKYQTPEIKKRNQDKSKFYDYDWKTRNELMLLLRQSVSNDLHNLYNKHTYNTFTSLRTAVKNGDWDFQTWSHHNIDHNWWWISFIKPDIDLNQIF